VGPRAVLDAVVKRKIPRTRRESNPRTLIVQPIAQRRRWKYDIKTDVKERGFEGVAWIQLVSDGSNDGIL
jgi:hypothetical protein